MVDDSENILEINKLILEKMMPDWSVVTTSNGYMALEIIKNKKFDIMITDLEMPIMSGLRLIAYLRSFSDIPVILYSSVADEVDSRVLESLCITKAICKPCCCKLLATEIKNAVEKR